MTAYENITEVLDRIEKVSKKGLNYAIELEDIEQLQEAQQQVKNNDLLHSVRISCLKEAWDKWQELDDDTVFGEWLYKQGHEA